MKQNQNSKRSRGRGRRQGNSSQNSFNRNTTFDSNGPEGRVRGNAQQLFEKYTALAHDAQSSGDRVLFEANSQFADHYYRIQQSILANAEQKRQNDARHQEARNNGEGGEAGHRGNRRGSKNEEASGEQSADDAGTQNAPEHTAETSDSPDHKDQQDAALAESESVKGEADDADTDSDGDVKEAVA
ncbi:MAG: DUF4167 domain-containing protein [Candidatus Puniceispirillaceae bacterium]